MHSRDAEAVVDAVHRFNDPQSEIRRWWTDSALEFAAAAGTVTVAAAISRGAYVKRGQPAAEATTVADKRVTILTVKLNK